MHPAQLPGRRKAAKQPEKQAHNTHDSAESRNAPCNLVDVNQTRRVKRAVCFVSSHYITNEPPSGGGWEGRESRADGKRHLGKKTHKRRTADRERREEGD